MTKFENIGKIYRPIDITPVFDLGISTEEQSEIDELANTLNSANFDSTELVLRGTSFCDRYNQIKGYISSTTSLLNKASNFKILPGSWRDAFKKAAQLIELLRQVCEQVCP